MYRTSIAKYLNGIPPDSFIYEDDKCVAFEEELHPQAPVHIVVTSKKSIVPRLSDASGEDEKLLGHLLIIAHNVAKEHNLHSTGYHVVVDEDLRTFKFRALHVFGRSLQHMIWPVYMSRL